MQALNFKRRINEKASRVVFELCSSCVVGVVLFLARVCRSRLRLKAIRNEKWLKRESNRLLQSDNPHTRSRVFFAKVAAAAVRTCKTNSERTSGKCCRRNAVSELAAIHQHRARIIAISAYFERTSRHSPRITLLTSHFASLSSRPSPHLTLRVTFSFTRRAMSVISV